MAFQQGGSSAAQNEFAIHTVLDERYQLLELAGRGGSGVVYKAMDLNLQREVAVKILSADGLNQSSQYESFQRESQILRQLRAINTVFFYDCGMTPNGLPYMVMEFVVGKPLKALLEEEGYLDPERVVNILVQVFSSLQEAHDLGFVHRDLKPANIMLLSRVGQSSDFVKVLDFGVAKVLSEKNDESKNELFGTPKYMPPEQFRNEPVTPQSDLYSMGCVAYEMLAGFAPFDGDTLHVMITKHLFMTPPKFNASIACYPNLVGTIFKLLQKDPAYRFSSAQAVNDALAHWREPELLPQLADSIFAANNAEGEMSFDSDDNDCTVPLMAPPPSMFQATMPPPPKPIESVQTITPKPSAFVQHQLKHNDTSAQFSEPSDESGIGAFLSDPDNKLVIIAVVAAVIFVSLLIIFMALII